MEKVLIKRTERIDYYREGGSVYQRFRGASDYRLVGAGRLLNELLKIPYKSEVASIKVPVVTVKVGVPATRGVDVASVVKDYVSGMSGRELSKKYGIHFTGLLRLIPADVVRRSGGRPKKDLGQVRFRALVVAGMSRSEIMAEMGITVGQYQYLKNKK